MDRRLALLAVSLLAVLAHVESLEYWFVSTDTLPLIESSRVSSPSDLVGLFANPMMHGTRFTEVGLFYRPIASLTYAIDYAVWGLDPFGYHLTNLVLHGLAAVLAAVSIAAVIDRPLVGYASALGFAVHPITAEVVPTAARRHDVLMTIFVLAALTLFVRSQRRGSRLALVGASFAYLLALGSKELAILVPGVIAAWAFLYGEPSRTPPEDQGAVRSDSEGELPSDARVRARDRRGSLVTHRGGLATRVALTSGPVRRRARTALRAASPFVLVSIGYLAVRIAVLGGLGGYEGRAFVAGDLVLIPIDYLLSVTYQANVIEATVGTSSRHLLAVVPAIALAWLGFDRIEADDSIGSRRREALRTALGAGFVVGLSAVVFVLAFAPELVAAIPEPFRYPWLVSVLVGVSFVLGCLCGLGAALLGRRRPLDPALVRDLAFLGTWLVLPLGLFYAGGDFSMRSGYPFVAPALAALLVLGADAIRTVGRHLRAGLRARRRTKRGLGDENGARRERQRSELGANAGLLVIVALLVVPQMAVSPLFYEYAGWEGAGEINRQALTGIEAQLEGASTASGVVVVGLPSGVSEQRRAFPRAESVGYLRENSIESWLRLRRSDSDGPAPVAVVGTEPIPRVSDDVTFETTRSERTIVIDVRYGADRQLEIATETGTY